MGLILYSCPYVPAELIAAYGLVPVRLPPVELAGKGPVVAGAGVCAFMRGFVNEACAVPGCSAVVVATTCDQMRRAKDYLDQQAGIPSFLFNVPAAWHANAVDLYISELARLGCFLEGVGGSRPSRSRLWQALEEYDGKREQLAGWRGVLTAREFSAGLDEFNRTGVVNVRSGAGVGVEGGVPLALVGGPLARRDFEVFDLISEAGGNVVLDGTETGERTMPARLDRRNLGSGDPFVELAAGYFCHIPDVFSRPNSRLYCWLGREIERRGIKGIVLIRRVWCDKWHSEVGRLREWLKIPLLDLELDSELGRTRASCRVAAFMEMFA